MRIRSIVPKFWESKDIERLSWDTRLLFIGLWSYADDNGVGRDDPRLIAADLFPLADDPLDIRARVSRGLQALCSGGQIVRYTVDGEPFYFVSQWDKYQRVDRPAKERYKRPTCEDTGLTIEIAKPSRDIRETVATGEGEKGRRGEGEKLEIPSSAVPMARFVYPDPFERFWKTYPRGVAKKLTFKTWQEAIKSKPADEILAAAERVAADPNLPDKRYIPHPTTWLRGGGWDDDPFPPRFNTQPAVRPSTSNARVSEAAAAGQRLMDSMSGHQLPRSTQLEIDA